jgi:hypothetical protein
MSGMKEGTSKGQGNAGDTDCLVPPSAAHISSISTSTTPTGIGTNTTPTKIVTTTKGIRPVRTTISALAHRKRFRHSNQLHSIQEKECQQEQEAGSGGGAPVQQDKAVPASISGQHVAEAARKRGTSLYQSALQHNTMSVKVGAMISSFIDWLMHSYTLCGAGCCCCSLLTDSR